MDHCLAAKCKWNSRKTNSLWFDFTFSIWWFCHLAVIYLDGAAYILHVPRFKALESSSMDSWQRFIQSYEMMRLCCRGSGAWRGRSMPKWVDKSKCTANGVTWWREKRWAVVDGANTPPQAYQLINRFIYSYLAMQMLEVRCNGVCALLYFDWAIMSGS